MTIDPGPFDMVSTRVVLDPQGSATPKPVTPSFYADLDRDFDGFAGCVLLSKYEFDEAWPSWEIHPKGDEIVYLLFGDVDFVLWSPDGEQTVRVDQPGSFIVVPKGTWHTARPRKPTGMLFVTPGEGTENAEQPPASGAR